jgi:tetratricopeptide (TPR) repeat protein
VDAETLAAFIDGRLEPRERAAVEAHLAECTDCYEVWMASGVAFRDEADLEKLVVRTHPQRQTRAWLYAGAGLAAAAAIALVVTSPQLFNRNQITDLHELVDAVGGNRRTEARLTGGFQWGAVPPIRRGDSNALPVAIEAVATKLTQMPDGGRAETVALKGVAALILGDSANAVTQLESAVARESGRARFWSDLAAAYLEAARTGGRSRGVDDALSAANRALQIDPALPEALFNRALALEQSGNFGAARTAWAEYLRVDPTSDWAREAERRLAAVSK